MVPKKLKGKNNQPNLQYATLCDFVSSITGDEQFSNNYENTMCVKKYQYANLKI